MFEDISNAEVVILLNILVTFIKYLNNCIEGPRENTWKKEN